MPKTAWIAQQWAENFFYPLPGCCCVLCGYPAAEPTLCAACRARGVPAGIKGSAFLSYTWGKSRSPAYAFKTRKNFDEDLRITISRLFGIMAWARFGTRSATAVVIGVPPRQSYKYGVQDHLDDLLASVEATFQVERNALSFAGPGRTDPIVFTDARMTQAIRGRDVIIVDNTWNTGRTATSAARTLLLNGATGAYFCIMSRWIAGDVSAVEAAKNFRSAVCPEIADLGRWYEQIYCSPASPT